MTTCTTNTTSAQSRRPARTSALRWIALFFAAHRQRRKLANLDARMLRDIGLNRDLADREARRKPWDVPSHWLK